MKRIQIKLIFFLIMTAFVEAWCQNFQLISNFETPGSPYGVFVRDNYAYVADYDSGLQIIDIGNPANPVIIGDIDTLSYAGRIFISGQNAFIGGGYGYTNLYIVDISNPTAPILISSISTTDQVFGISVSGDYAYIAENLSGLQIYNISDLANPVLAGGYDTPDCAADISVAGSYAYVADASNGLLILNISDPANPALTGNFDPPYWIWDVSVIGNYAYLSCSSAGLHILDISDPANPIHIGSCVIQYDNGPLFVSGNFAFLGSGNSHMVSAVNIADPTNPIFAGSYDTGGLTFGLSASNDYVYLARLSRFLILHFNSTGIYNDCVIPDDFSLSQSYPNPFNAQTTISYSLPASSDVSLDIFDILGRKIETLQSGHQDAGEHSVVWNAGNASSGAYFYRLKAGERSETNKMLLIK
jgi:hypothetical protein